MAVHWDVIYIISGMTWVYWMVPLKTTSSGTASVSCIPSFWDKSVSQTKKIMPWVCKICLDGKVAVAIFPFVDNERAIGPSDMDTWHTEHVLGGKQAYL